MNIIDYAKWLGVALGIIGAVMNAAGKKNSFWFYIASNIIFITISLLARDWQFLTLYGVYTVISAYGLFKWKGNAETK